MTALSLGCEYRAKQKSNVKQHRADVHDVGVTWHECPEPNCSHKVKQKGNNQEAQSQRARHQRNLACLH